MKEVEKQREIGKQILLVRIIQCENDKAERGLMSRIDRDDMAEWASISKREINNLINICGELNWYCFIRDLALYVAYSKKYSGNQDVFLFLFYTYMKNGRKILTDIDPDLMDEFCSKKYLKNYYGYNRTAECDFIGKEYATPEFMENALDNCVSYYVYLIRQALSHGYDWDVIKEMTKTEITKERFRVLEEAFRFKGKEWSEGYKYFYP